MQKRVAVRTASEGRVLVQPIDFLGDRFHAYRAACEGAGAVYRPALKGNVCEARQLPELVARLDAAQLTAVLTDDLRDLLLTEAAAAAQAEAEGDTAVSRAVKRAAEVGLTFFRFQLDGIRVLAEESDWLLADEMGLGKTIQVLGAIPDGAPVLVVCPASLKGNWAREIRKWRPELEVRVLSGRGSFRFPAPGEAVVVNYDILPPSVGPAAAGTVAVVDEAHALKSPKSQRTERWMRIGEAVKAAGGRRWLLTGTPLLNTPPELWNVLKAAGLESRAFGGWMGFVRAFNGCRGSHGWEFNGDPNPVVGEKLQRVMLRRTRREVLPDLPGKVRQLTDCSIKAADSRELDALAEDILRKTGVDIRTATEEAELAAAERAAFTECSRVRRVLATAKVPAMLEAVARYEAEGQPLVVFSAHRAPVEALGGRPGWETFGGSSEERAQQVERYQRGELKGLAATIQMGGTGLTLTRGNHVLFVDVMWTPELNKQAEDRVCRIGQDRTVQVSVLVAEHAMDQRVNEVNEAKIRLVEGSVEEAEVVELERASRATQLTALVSRVGGSVDAIQRERRAERERKFRGPESELEKWAALVLPVVAGCDPDRARDLNGIGFSAFDGDLGHSLVRQLDGGLTEKQWALAVRLATKYRRQGAAAGYERPEVSA